MKVVALVPIKLNNERFPNKNIRKFTNGESLVSHVLNSLIKVRNIDECYVYCSSEGIVPYLPEGVIYKMRDPSLDTSTTKINEVLSAFATDVEADIYVLVHATAPFITVGSIETGINAVINEGYDSSLTVTKMQDFIWRDGVPANYDPSNIPRTQDLSPYFVETSGMYVFTRPLILKENRRVGHRPFLVEISKIEAIDIDEKEDFIIADAIYSYLRGMTFSSSSPNSGTESTPNV